MNASRAWVSVCVVIGLLAGTASALTMATVPVGNPGNMADTSAHSGNPAGQGAVSYTYNIGTYEVTAGQYAEFLNKVGGVDTYGLYNTSMSDTTWGSGITRSGGGTVGAPYTYTVASSHVNRPVSYVSYWDSCRFANWMNNGQPAGAQGAGTTERGTYTLDGYKGTKGETIQRNPGSTWAVTSEDEWYKAAYYKGGSTNAGYWDYPTRSNTAPGRDMADISGNNANYSPDTGPSPIDSPYYATVVGEFQNSASPYGTFDQGGNVSEWNEAIVRQDATYVSRGTRGVSFSADINGLLASSRGLTINPSSEAGSRGFRVSEVPEPATIVMLALAGVGIIRRRKA